jgi:asparagine synthase (glutamine-hydrolysing)
MCGLCGVAWDDPRRKVEAEFLERGARTIAHRGPDDFGHFERGSFGLAFRRLSIIDVAGGHQPLLNETEDVALVFNGEVYNFRRLRADLERAGHRFRTRADSEVVLHLYEERGEDLCSELVGMYAFAILDFRPPDGPRLLLARDRLGKKPLYYVHGAQGLGFASEPKVLLEWGLAERRAVPEALLDFLVSGYVSGDKSSWPGVERVPPAHTLSYRPGERPRLRRYWDLPHAEPTSEPSPEEILALLDRAVAERLESDVPLGAFLSGGVDSSAVVDSMKRAALRPVVACSVGFAEKSHDEVAVARATAQRLGIEHHVRVLVPDPGQALAELPWMFDEPHADPSDLPTWLVSKVAREHVTVALSGDGGDETFAGYRRYVHDWAENRVRARLGRRGTRAAARIGAGYPKLDWAPRFLRARTFLTNVGRDPARAYWHSVTQMSREDALRLLSDDLRLRLGDYDPFARFEQFYRRVAYDDPLFRAQYADFHTYLPDQILVKADRASMGVGLELRCPLLDHRLVERCAPMPSRAKLRAGRGKHAFREALRSRLPSSILDGTKRGFDTPLKRWLCGPLAGPAREAIEELPQDWFSRERLRLIFAQHQSGARDHARLLWSLLILEHWRRRHGVGGLAA